MAVAGSLTAAFITSGITLLVLSGETTRRADDIPFNGCHLDDPPDPAQCQRIADLTAEAARLEGGGVAMMALSSLGVGFMSLFLLSQSDYDDPEQVTIAPMVTPRAGGVVAMACF